MLLDTIGVSILSLLFFLCSIARWIFLRKFICIYLVIHLLKNILTLPVPYESSTCSPCHGTLYSWLKPAFWLHVCYSIIRDTLLPWLVVSYLQTYIAASFGLYTVFILWLISKNWIFTIFWRNTTHSLKVQTKYFL